jgi:predicted nucleic acid-binding protein
LIVVDASLVADYLLQVADYPSISAVIANESMLAAPDLIRYEVSNILRRHNIFGDLSDRRAAEALSSFKLMRFNFYDVQLLEERAWELRHNVTFYDASYIALAELLECPLYTRDGKMARSPGHRANIITL